MVSRAMGAPVSEASGCVDRGEGPEDECPAPRPGSWPGHPRGRRGQRPWREPHGFTALPGEGHAPLSHVTTEQDHVTTLPGVRLWLLYPLMSLLFLC